MTAGVSDGSRKRCVVTGTTGYVGGRIAAALDRAGWKVTPLDRATRSDFSLPDLIPRDVFAGATALVHAAYDFSPRTPAAITKVNLEGSRKLFETARTEGVDRLVFLSSMSAFPGCTSNYGKVKLAIEQLVLVWGGVSLRPGLVWGEGAGGMFGALARPARSWPIIPVPGKGGQALYLVHHDDLCEVVERALSLEPAQRPADPILVAHPQAATLSEIVAVVAAASGREPRLIPVPAAGAMIGLKTAERLGLRLRLRSDSLLGIVQERPPEVPDPCPLGISLRAFMDASERA